MDHIVNGQLPIYIDSTMMATFRSCQRKFYNNYIINKVLDGNNVHLTAGGAIAHAMDTVRKLQFGKPPIQIDELMGLAFKPFVEKWGDLDVPMDQAKNIHNCLWALEEYLRHYHPATDPVQPLARADGTPTTEFTFAVPLPIHHPNGDPFVYCGRFDLLGRYTFNDLLVVLDEKTSGSLGAAWARQWDMRGQFIGYVWACQQLGYNVKDVLVRGIGIYKTEPKLLAVPTAYPTHLVDRWYKQLLLTLEKLVWCYTYDQWDYDFADACSSYGGCPYQPMCLSSVPERFYSNYTDRTWAPISNNEAIN